jgi:hypothetical protein
MKTLTQKKAWACWLTSIIPATLEAEAGGSQAEASPAKVSEPLSQKRDTNNKNNELGAWLKWYSACLACTR